MAQYYLADGSVFLFVFINILILGIIILCGVE